MGVLSVHAIIVLRIAPHTTSAEALQEWDGRYKVAMADKNDYKAIGARIRAARSLRGLKQDWLGARIGVTYGAISHWESGKAISIPKLMAIARVLRVRLQWLIEGKEPMDEAPNPLPHRSTPGGGSRSSAWCQLAGP